MVHLSNHDAHVARRPLMHRVGLRRPGEVCVYPIRLVRAVLATLGPCSAQTSSCRCDSGQGAPRLAGVDAQRCDTQCPVSLSWVGAALRCLHDRRTAGGSRLGGRTAPTPTHCRNALAAHAHSAHVCVWVCVDVDCQLAQDWHGLEGLQYCQCQFGRLP